MATEYNVELFDVLDTSDLEDFDFNNYFLGERDILAPALEAAGYTLQGQWWSSEKDSYGPLSRAIRAIAPNGDKVVLWYG